MKFVSDWEAQAGRDSLLPSVQRDEGQTGHGAGGVEGVCYVPEIGAAEIAGLEDGGYFIMERAGGENPLHPFQQFGDERIALTG